MNLNEDAHITLVAEMFYRDSTFCQYKIYADIHWCIHGCVQTVPCSIGTLVFSQYTICVDIHWQCDAYLFADSSRATQMALAVLIFLRMELSCGPAV